MEGTGIFCLPIPDEGKIVVPYKDLARVEGEAPNGQGTVFCDIFYFEAGRRLAFWEACFPKGLV